MAPLCCGDISGKRMIPIEQTQQHDGKAFLKSEFFQILFLERRARGFGGFRGFFFRGCERDFFGSGKYAFWGAGFFVSKNTFFSGFSGFRDFGHFWPKNPKRGAFAPGAEKGPFSGPGGGA